MAVSWIYRTTRIWKLERLISTREEPYARASERAELRPWAVSAPLNSFAASCIDVQNGTISFIGGGNSTGVFNAASGQVIQFTSGTQQLNAGAAFNGSGLFQVTGGIVNCNGAISVNQLAQTSGTIGGMGTLTVTGNFAWTGGFQDGVAGGTTTLAIAAGGTLSISGTATKYFYNGRTMNLAGIGTWTGTGPISAGGADSALIIQSGGLFDMQSDQTIDVGSVIIQSGGTLRNSGAANGTTTFSQFDFVTNNGTLDITAGTLSINNYSQLAGTTILDGGNFVFATFMLAGGTLTGSGSATGNVVNGGTIAPGNAGAGTIAITGNYTQTSGGALNLELGGTTPGAQFDVLTVSGSATLNGTLSLALINGFAPAPANVFQVLSCNSLSGTFSTLSDGGSGLIPLYAANSVTLAAGGSTPNPAPVLTSISPSTAQARGASFTLIATGTSFTGKSVVQWNGTGRTTTFISATTLNATIPAIDIMAAGTANVTVFTPAPGGGTTLQVPFTITAVPGSPIITAFVSDQNPGLFTAPIQFELTATDTDTPTLSYSVNFGDNSAPATGSFPAGSTALVTHTYGMPGNFNVTAIVTDGTTPVAAVPIMQVNPSPTSGGLRRSPIFPTRTTNRRLSIRSTNFRWTWPAATAA